MAVELPAKATAILSPFGGMSLDETIRIEAAVWGLGFRVYGLGFPKMSTLHPSQYRGLNNRLLV